MIAWIKLRLRARRFGRMREDALTDWWLNQIRSSSTPREVRAAHRCEYADPAMCGWPGHRR